jgi:hypothetical protein
MSNYITSSQQKPHKIYDLIFDLLTDNPELRDSDKRLQHRIWTMQDVNLNDEDSYVRFAKSPETIRRTRQKIQELNPDLQSSKWIRKQRNSIAEQKGTHIFREEVTVSETHDKTQTAMF